MRDNKKRYSNNSCYACSLKAVNKEHVPPKVFFPERKDLPFGFPDMRQNLVTVPSCNRHNTEKSEDDFYAFSVIVLSFDTSYIAHHQFSKFLRAMHRNPSLIKSVLNEDSFPLRVNGEITRGTPVDYSRFENFLICLSKGIYYQHFNRKWDNQFYVFPLSFIKQPNSPENVRYINEVASIRESTNYLFDKEEKFGSNQDIFYYQIHQEPNEEEIVLRMIFYGGFEIMASEKFK